ncbi:MAG: VCBS repeat-containing protein [Candidatus Latescibacteria bacterium]|nr:VCBS repeat-containing protein [Candidatus Latescibacterota bacterium]
MLKRRWFALIGAAVMMLTGRAGAAGPLREVSREAGLDRVEARGAVRVDFDGDGSLDLMLFTQKGLALYRNQQGRFEEAGLPFGRGGDGVSAAAWGDFDRDGDPDLFTTSRDGASRLYRNDGGAFVDVAGRMGVGQGGGMAAAWGDFDGDGDLDLFCAGPRTANRLYRNEGSRGRFVEVGQEAGVAETRTTRVGAWGDYDHDGDPDLYLVDGSGLNQLLRNEGGAIHGRGRTGGRDRRGGRARGYVGRFRQ